MRVGPGLLIAFTFYEAYYCSMKNRSKFALELLIILLVASLLSSVISLGLGFIMYNLGTANTDTIGYVNMLAAVSWGVYVGYKVKSLIEQHRA